MADLSTRLPPLSPDHREVLLALGTWRDDWRPYLRTVARDCALPVERVRAIIRQFDSLGWVTYGPLANDDGHRAGSTWWLTEAGTAARDLIENERPTT